MCGIFCIIPIVVSAMFSGASASALAMGQVNAQQSPLYNCDVLIVSAEHTLEKMITVPSKMAFNQAGNQVASHQVRLTQDPHDVSVVVDGQWIVINWTKEGQNLAAGAFVLGTPSKSPRVAILYNPANFNEQVSVSCTPKGTSGSKSNSKSN